MFSGDFTYNFFHGILIYNCHRIVMQIIFDSHKITERAMYLNLIFL